LLEQDFQARDFLLGFGLVLLRVLQVFGQRRDPLRPPSRLARMLVLGQYMTDSRKTGY